MGSKDAMDDMRDPEVAAALRKEQAAGAKPDAPSRAALAAALEDIIAVYEWCSADPAGRGYSSLSNEIHRAKRLLALSNGERGT